MSNELKRIGAQMANTMFNLAQRAGDVIDSDLATKFDKMRKEWDAAVRATPSPSTASTEQNQAADLNVLPPLPEPDHSLDCGMQPFYRPDQMHSYARAALASKPVARDAAPLAYIAPHVMESLRAGCHVATTLTPKPDGSNTEALYGR